MKTEDHPLSALIVKEDGLIYVNEVPEEPQICMSYVLGHCLLTVCSCHDLQKAYERQLASAKESAVLVADQEQAQQLLWHRYPLTVIRDGKWDVAPGIYPIPDLKWEVRGVFEKNPDYLTPENQNRDNPILGYRRKVAILK